MSDILPSPFQKLATESICYSSYLKSFLKTSVSAIMDAKQEFDQRRRTHLTNHSCKVAIEVKTAYTHQGAAIIYPFLLVFVFQTFHKLFGIHILYAISEFLKLKNSLVCMSQLSLNCMLYLCLSALIVLVGHICKRFRHSSKVSCS